jgi:UDP-glucuronate 4-epimerase
MNDSFRRVLLTGGAGFIGSHLAEALLRHGSDLTVLDNLDDFYSPERKRSNLELVRKVGEFLFEEVDICDFQALRQAVKRTRPRTIVHLAARAGVRPSIEDPRLYESVNVTGTMNLLELCREFQVRKFIFGSSSSVYGASAQAPFSEDQVELRPISPYAATKLSAELLCYTYSHLFRLPIVCLRFFTVYGPRQRPDLAIYKFTELIEEGQRIPIFGDGLTGRDYTYVDDIVAGVQSAMRFDFARATVETPFEIFNLGNSRPVKLIDLLNLLEATTGRKAIRQNLPMQPGDVPLTWANVSKAERMLAYRPSTPIEQGLKHFVAWYRAQFDPTTGRAQTGLEGSRSKAHVHGVGLLSKGNVPTLRTQNRSNRVS